MTTKLVNFPKATNFRFYCSQLPLVSELVQDVTIPTMQIGTTEVPWSNGTLKQPGEKFLFTEIDIGFVMDENYDAYAEIFSWMTKLCGVPGIHRPEADRSMLLADAVIILLDNAQRETRRFIFHDAYPSTIGAMPFDATGEPNAVKSMLTMEYTAMSISPDTKNTTNLGPFNYSH